MTFGRIRTNQMTERTAASRNISYHDSCDKCAVLSDSDGLKGCVDSNHKCHQRTFTASIVPEAYIVSEPSQTICEGQVESDLL